MFIFLLFKITYSPSPVIVKSCNLQMLAWQVWTRQSEKWSCQVPGPKFSRKQHLPRALVNSKNLTLYLASFFFGVLEKGWMGKLGCTGGKGRKTVEVFFYRTAEVSVPYLVFGLVFMGSQLKYIKDRCQKDWKVIWNNDRSWAWPHGKNVAQWRQMRNLHRCRGWHIVHFPGEGW